MVYFANFQHFTYVRLTFLHNQTRWSYVSYTCAMLHHGNARVDGVIYSTDLIFSSSCSRVWYVLSVWQSYEGWHTLFKTNMSWVVMSPRFSIRVHSAWWICDARIHSVQTEGVWGCTLSMQRLDAWIPFLWWTVMYVDASVTCWHKRFFSAGTLTMFRKSLSENRVAPPSYYRVLTVNSYIQVRLWLASVQVSRRSQGTLLPSSSEPKVSNPWNKCVTQNLI
jgi:hypothetical protein